MSKQQHIMRAPLIIIFLLVVNCVFAQHNFLGKSRIDIVGFYTLDRDFTIKTKRVSDTKILITARGHTQYPYYTYELDTQVDECISVGIVSKNSEVLTHYEGMLSFWGEILEVDDATNTEVYIVDTHKGTFRYKVSQPYKYSEEYVSRRNIFYILMTKEVSRLHAAK